ncbi:MFS transporter [Gemmatimonas sp.]|uniref:MFS transporter n=1 Tax=Gemmatimonas sp. TaxID=1962908 RepID=UPI003DA625B0
MAPPRRWTVPLGAVLVHMGIGSVYAWSTLNRPITAALPSLPWWASPPYTTFTSALVLLGLSAATWGPWVEKRGARTAARLAALCFSCGLVVGGAGLILRQPLLLFLGLGILCGIGCGIGYIAPVSTLVKWFPDRRGMATGFAIMGFGGGAFLGGYANAFLVERVGIANALFVLGGAYLLIMLAGSTLLRPAPAPVRLPDDATPSTHASIVAEGMTRREALRTPQFALLWGMLCINVTAGIGILAQASPMMQDLFGRTPAEAAAVVAIISVFNAGGRLLWSSASDYHRTTQQLRGLLHRTGGVVLAHPALREDGRVVPVPWLPVGGVHHVRWRLRDHSRRFLADLFGSANVGAIHGALLTAWSVAAVAGPVIITELSSRARAALGPGMSKVAIYDQPLQLLAALLAVGLVLTLMVRPIRR